MRKFTEYDKINEDKLPNYIITYTSESRGGVTDMSIASDDILDLAQKLKNSMSESEFNSITNIKVGSMSFGTDVSKL